MTNLTHFSTAAIIFQARTSSLGEDGAASQKYAEASVRHRERRHGGCVAARREKRCQGRPRCMPACQPETMDEVQGWLRIGSMMIALLGRRVTRNATPSLLLG